LHLEAQVLVAYLKMVERTVSMTIHATRDVTYNDAIRLSTVQDSELAPENETPQQLPQPDRADPDDLRRWTDEAAQQWSHTLARLAE